MKQAVKRLSLVCVAIVILGAASYGLYRQFAWVEMDLTPLAEFADAQNYASLIRKVQAKPVGPDGFTFVALGDTRSNINIAREVLQQVAEEKPTFIISNGDLVRRGRVEEYVAHHIPLVELLEPIPFIPVPGNHESGPNGDFSAFRYIYGGERFSFDYGDCRFVGINNGDSNGLSSGDLDYLESELGKPGVNHRFVIFHIPPRYMENAVESEGTRGFTWNAGKLRSLMTRMRVDQVFVGHVHGFASEMVDGVRYTITGGAGASLTTNLGPEGNVHNYVLVHVGPEGVKNEVVRLVNGQWVRNDIE